MHASQRPARDHGWYAEGGMILILPLDRQRLELIVQADSCLVFLPCVPFSQRVIVQSAQPPQQRV